MINVNRPVQTVDKRMNIHRYEMWGSATFRTSGFFIQFCHKAHTRPAHCLMRIVNVWCCGQNPAYPQNSATVNYYHHSVYKLLVVNLATLVQVAGLPKKSRLRPMSVIKASTWQKNCPTPEVPTTRHRRDVDLAAVFPQQQGLTTWKHAIFVPLCG